MAVTNRVRLFLMFFAAVVLCSGLSGCSGLYLLNRCDDFGDIFEGNLGVCLYTSHFARPHFLVSLQATRLGHFAVGNAVVGRLGLYGGEWDMWTESGAALPVAPFAYLSRGERQARHEEFWRYALFDRWDWFLFLPSYYRDVWTPELKDAEIGAKMDSAVHWFDVAVDVAPLLPAVRIGFSPGEFVDFMVGFVGLDPADDDERPGDAVEDYLKKLLKKAQNGGRRARRTALMAAHHYRPHSQAWEILRAACDWDDVRMRGAAYYLITEGNWSYTDALPIMIRLLEDPDPRMRRNAIGRLGNMKGKADVSVPPLVAILDLKDRPDERGLAAGAMVDIAGESSQETQDMVARALGRHLDDKDYNVRIRCQAGLEILRDGAFAAIPDLIRMIQFEDPEDRFFAVKLLGRMGKLAEGALPAIEKALNDPNARVRHAAEWAIKRITR